MRGGGEGRVGTGVYRMRFVSLSTHFFAPGDPLLGEYYNSKLPVHFHFFGNTVWIARVIDITG